MISAGKGEDKTAGEAETVMGNSKPTGAAGGAKGVTVDFGSHFAESKLFAQVFAEGMNLVEETANYLDGDGRTDARGLSRHAAIAYASESMRLTTRLMQLASWLLLRRAVNEGEMTLGEAEREKHRVNLDEVRPTISEQALQSLPDQLSNLIIRSNRLYDRVHKLDTMLNNGEMPQEPEQANPLGRHFDRLKAAFGKSQS